MGCEAAPETGQPHRSFAVLGSSYRGRDDPALNDLLIVPTLCVVTPLRTLRVLGDAERHGMHFHAERGERSANPGLARSLLAFPGMIVPTLRVVTPLRTLRVLGDAERHGMHSHAEREERSANPSLVRSPLAFPGMIVPTLCVVTPLRTLRVLGDAERHGMNSHAEREERSIAAHPLLRVARRSPACRRWAAKRPLKPDNRITASRCSAAPTETALALRSMIY